MKEFEMIKTRMIEDVDTLAVSSLMLCIGYITNEFIK